MYGKYISSFISDDKLSLNAQPSGIFYDNFGNEPTTFISRYAIRQQNVDKNYIESINVNIRYEGKIHKI